VTLSSFAAAIVSFAACLTDLRWRRIPNVLTLGGAAAALLVQLLLRGSAGATSAAAGWAIGLALFLPIFALRGIGGGDVKLLAALGAWLGPMPAVWLAFWSAIAGGVFALIVAGAHGYTGRAFTNVWGMLSYWRVMGMQPHPAVTLETAAGPRLPYSLPIAAGLGMTLWLA
jgi:prepilin peptidase CpaA